MLERQLGIDKMTARRPVDRDLHLRLDRPAQGSDAQLRQHRLERPAIDQVVQLTEDDVLCGILPFFHSFGFTVTLWAVLALEYQGGLPLQPARAQQVGKLCDEHDVTILLSTPTFLRELHEAHRAGAFRLARRGGGRSREAAEPTCATRSSRSSACGPSKAMARPSCRRWCRSTFRPAERTADSRRRAEGRDRRSARARRDGQSGRIPNPGADLPVGEAGLLLIKGPNVMQGYLGQPELTAKVMRDGWYMTGDMAKLDADGFITITGRQSRFSKIGGEMVPHGRVEEAAAANYSPATIRSWPWPSRPCPTSARANA